MIFQFLLQRQVIEFATQGKLSIDFLLADAKVFDIEESNVLSRIRELFCELYLASRFFEDAQVEGNELCPINLQVMSEEHRWIQKQSAYDQLWFLGSARMGKEWLPAS